MFENYGMIIKTFTTILEFHVKENFERAEFFFLEILVNWLFSF